MYNTSRSAVPARKWKPAPSLVPQHQRGEYATTQWREHDEHEDDGFDDDAQLHHHLDNFAQARIEPLSHPLPKQILAALTLLEQTQLKQASQAKRQQQIEEAKKGPVDLDAKGDESENAHLPFVPVSYTPVGWDGKPLKEDASFAAESDAQDQESPAMTSQEDDDRDESHEPFEELTPEVFEASLSDVSTLEAVAQPSDDETQDVAADSTPIESSEPALAQTQTEEEADAHEQVATASQEVQEIEELQESQEQVCDSQGITTDSSDDQVPLEADQAEPDSVVELPESEVVTDEVLSTQADTQETEEEQALQHTEPEVVSGVPEDEVVQREQSHYLRGLEAGKQQVRQELEQQVKDQCAVLASVSEQLNTLLQEQAKLYAPLKRLSLHIAQQLVLGELKQPTEIVERLVQRCLDELNLPQNGLVSVELNEQDKALLEAQDSQLLQGMRLEVASDLLSGSVRVKANDTIVEDFVQDRLKSVVKALSLEDASWESNSVLLHDQDQQEETGE